MKCLAPLALCATLAAQIPDGSFVVSSFDNGPLDAPFSSGGLFVVDPLVPGPPVAVTGLPLSLTGPHASDSQGARCVSVRQDDRILMVGEVVPAGQTLHVHEVALSALQLVGDSAFPVGVAGAAGAEVVDVESVAGGLGTLFCTNGLATGPSLGMLGVDGTVTALDLSGLDSGPYRAVAVDETNLIGFVAIDTASGTSTNVYSFPLENPTAGAFVASVFGMRSLAADVDGNLIAGSTLGGGQIFSIDPVSGVASFVAFTGPTPTAVNVRRATNQPIYALDGSGPNGAEVAWLDSGGGATVLTAGIPGSVSGIDLIDNPRIYGAPTPGAVTYRWQHAGSPDGLPRRGNGWFTIELDSDAPGTTGALIASPSPGDMDFMGVRVLLDPTALIPVAFVPGAGTISLPVSNNVPIGLALCFQTFHPDAGSPTIAASDGIRITVMP